MSTQRTTLSDVVADQVVRLRKRLDMTREQLAARCADLGYPALTAPALANIETGRRKSDGTRRRDVTADELAVLAKALQVAPLLLLFPVGSVDAVELLPGQRVDTWAAAQWFTGEAFMAEDATTHWAVPLYLFREHQRLVGEHTALLYRLRNLAPPADAAEETRQRAQADEAVRRLREVRADMRRHGLTPPRLDGDLQDIDSQPPDLMTLLGQPDRG